MARSFRSQADMARYQKRQRRIKYWVAWVPILSAFLTSVYLLLDAIGAVAPPWEKWLAFVLFSLTFFTLAKPTKDIRDVLFDSMRLQRKQRQ